MPLFDGSHHSFSVSSWGINVGLGSVSCSRDPPPRRHRRRLLQSKRRQCLAVRAVTTTSSPTSSSEGEPLSSEKCDEEREEEKKNDAKTKGESEPEPEPEPEPTTTANNLPRKRQLLFLRRIVTGVALAAISGIMVFVAHSSGMAPHKTPHLPTLKVVQEALVSLESPLLIATARLVATYVIALFVEPATRFCFETFGNPAKSWNSSFVRKMLAAAKQPVQVVLVICTLGALGEHVATPWLSLDREVVHTFTNRATNLAVVLAMARITYAWKEQRKALLEWEAEIASDVTDKVAIAGVDKLYTAIIAVSSIVLGLQAIGYSANSLLAIGGFGGIALGFAGKDLAENYLIGFMLLVTRQFTVGDTVTAYVGGREVHGTVVESGWYRTRIRNLKHEEEILPNSLFSTTPVVNVSRRGRVFRFNEMLQLEPGNVDKVAEVVKGFRAVLRKDERVIQSGVDVHRRVFIFEIKPEAIVVYTSFYIRAANLDAYYAAKESLLLAFTDVMKQQDVRFARPYGGIAEALRPPRQEESVPEAVEVGTLDL